MSGMTLTEVVVAAVIISVIFAAFLKITAVVAKAVQYSKFRSLATVLAQEKVQIIKQLSYYKILVSVSPQAVAGFPVGDVMSDTTYFPPEVVTEGGITFTRYTYIQVAVENMGTGVITTLPATTPDTGMRLVTVSVAWRQAGGELKRVQINSIASNPDSPMSNSTISGVVRKSGLGTPIQGASVIIAENPGWSAVTDASGNYTLDLLPGPYTVVASMPGYFTVSQSTSALAQTAVTGVNFSLPAMSSGIVKGTAWLDNHLVISAVVGSSPTVTNHEQEYVELFNPTTWTWTVNGDLGLYWKGSFGGAAETQILFSTVASNTIAPGHFYLFANTSPVTMGGLSVNADAVWSPANNTGSFNPNLPCFNATGGGCNGNPASDNYNNAITVTEDNGTSSGGGLKLVSLTFGDQDRFGWDNASGVTPDPDVFEGTSFNHGSPGMAEREQFRRYSSTAGVSGFSGPWGPAYDSNSNEVDWTFTTTPAIAPRNSASAAQTVVAGTPAIGAQVTSSDGLSDSVTAASSGNPPVALFSLSGVSTGTWAVMVSNNGLMAQISTVTMTAGATVWIPGSATVPAWPATGVNAISLSSAATMGYVSGQVLNAAGVVIGSVIPVGDAFDPNTSASASTGRYFLPVSTGVWDVTANISGGSPSALATYVARSTSIAVSAGMIVNGVDFRLNQGGRITGKVTRDGINAIPGIALQAQNADGISVDQQVTSVNGRFTFVDLTTGVYTVQAVLDSGEVSVPDTVSTTVVVGATVDIGTFTITGAYGRISGKVTLNGQPIQTGVLIVASTAAVSTPPALSSNSLTGMAYYTANTREDGTFDLDVRGSTNPAYNLGAYYTSFASMASNVPIVSTKTYTNAVVWPGSTTVNVNFSFP